MVTVHSSGVSRPSDKGGPGHRDPERTGGQSPKKFLSALGASVWSKIKGVARATPALPFIRHCILRAPLKELGYCDFHMVSSLYFIIFSLDPKICTNSVFCILLKSTTSTSSMVQSTNHFSTWD